MAHGAPIRFGVANLDNSLTYEAAGDNLKCIYFAFGNAEGLTKDEVYESNKHLIREHQIVERDDFSWDDSAFAVELAHRYGYKMHPAILRFSQIREKFTKPGTRLVVFYRLNGDQVPDVPPAAKQNALASRNFVRTILVDKAYDGIEFHAIAGKVIAPGNIQFKNNTSIMARDPQGDPKCIVFSKGA